jgi:hypothetical protein
VHSRALWLQASHELFPHSFGKKNSKLQFNAQENFGQKLQSTIVSPTSPPSVFATRTFGILIIPEMSKVVVMEKEEEQQVIKPTAVTPAVDTSAWPLLLKNYERRRSRLTLRALDRGMELLMLSSSCPDGPFHTNSHRKRAFEARPEVVH